MGYREQEQQQLQQDQRLLQQWQQRQDQELLQQHLHVPHSAVWPQTDTETELPELLPQTGAPKADLQSHAKHDTCKSGLSDETEAWVRTPMQMENSSSAESNIVGSADAIVERRAVFDNLIKGSKYDAIELVLRIVNNILKQPTEARLRSVKLSAIQKRLGRGSEQDYFHACTALRAAGFIELDKECCGARLELPADNDLAQATELVQMIEQTRAFWQPPEDAMCVVCMSAPQNAVLVHGGTVHRCTCMACAVIVQRNSRGCPVCRKPIERVCQFYQA